MIIDRNRREPFDGDDGPLLRFRIDANDAVIVGVSDEQNAVGEVEPSRLATDPATRYRPYR